MTSFRVVAIPTSVAQSVRSTAKDPRYGHPAHASVAKQPAPCRHCLRLIEPGEEQILFTHDAFEGAETLPLPGPVYIHAKACERYSRPSEFPPALRHSPRTLNAYANGRRHVATEYVEDPTIDAAIQNLFARSDVDYIHVRSTTAGCFTFRIEKSPLASSRAQIIPTLL
jgi:Protein of unknown function (DUF1203)